MGTELGEFKRKYNMCKHSRQNDTDEFFRRLFEAAGLTHNAVIDKPFQQAASDARAGIAPVMTECRHYMISYRIASRVFAAIRRTNR